MSESTAFTTQVNADSAFFDSMVNLVDPGFYYTVFDYQSKMDQLMRNHRFLKNTKQAARSKEQITRKVQSKKGLKAEKRRQAAEQQRKLFLSSNTTMLEVQESMLQDATMQKARVRMPTKAGPALSAQELRQRLADKRESLRAGRGVKRARGQGTPDSSGPGVSPKRVKSATDSGEQGASGKNITTSTTTTSTTTTINTPAGSTTESRTAKHVSPAAATGTHASGASDSEAASSSSDSGSSDAGSQMQAPRSSTDEHADSSGTETSEPPAVQQTKNKKKNKDMARRKRSASADVGDEDVDFTFGKLQFSQAAGTQFLNRGEKHTSRGQSGFVAGGSANDVMMVGAHASAMLQEEGGQAVVVRKGLASKKAALKRLERQERKVKSRAARGDHMGAHQLQDQRELSTAMLRSAGAGGTVASAAQLKKMIKKQEKKKQKSRREWKERQEAVVASQRQRQERRQRNLDKRKQARQAKRVKRRKQKLGVL